MTSNKRYTRDNVDGLFWHRTDWYGQRKIAVHGLVNGKCHFIIKDEPPIDIDGVARELYKAVCAGLAEPCQVDWIEYNDD